MDSNHREHCLRLADYDYHLPTELIAKEPANPRDTSRLLVVARDTGHLTDSYFRDLGQHLNKSDLLVVNNTRVLKARLLGRLEPTGREIEILFANLLSERAWEVMLRPGKRVREGDRIELDSNIAFKVGSTRDHGLRIVEIEAPLTTRLADILERYGQLPLPPYIDREVRDEDDVNYQTVYGRSFGAVAAPTAGLHFSDRVFAALQEREIEHVELTLHVGIGSFLPIRTENPLKHTLKPERYDISESTADALNRARSEGRRIVAVGTTTTRTLEHVFRHNKRFAAGTGVTNLYILPGYKFTAVNGLLTNFHLPRTTLLLLAAAFTSRHIILSTYRHAVDKRYRFYSYGDCTLFI